MNAGAVVEYFLRRIGDTEGDRVGPAEILSLVDLGAQRFVTETEILRVETQLTADTSQTPEFGYYNLPSNCHLIKGVEYGGDPLHQATIAQMRQRYTDWRATSGTPLYFVAWPDRILLAPYPTEDAEPYLEYVRMPAATGDWGAIDLPAAFEEAALHRALSDWFAQEDDYHDAAKSGYHEAQYAALRDRGLAWSASRGASVARRVGRRGF